MSVRMIHGLEDLRTLVGTRLGTSPWLEITQERINHFAEATDDHQWIHVDPVRAATESPYGCTVAHGFLTLSLISGLAPQVFSFTGLRMMINYGLNRVRFPTPVKVGARVRLAIDLAEVNETRTGVQAVCKHTIEVEGDPRPACMAEQILRLFFEQTAEA